jgi:hypothetical protein
VIAVNVAKAERARFSHGLTAEVKKIIRNQRSLWPDSSGRVELGSTGHSCSDGNTYGNAYPTTDAYAEISAHAHAACHSAAAAVALAMNTGWNALSSTRWQNQSDCAA